MEKKFFDSFKSEGWTEIGTYGTRYCLLKKNGEIMVIDTFLDFVLTKPTKIVSEDGEKSKEKAKYVSFDSQAGC